jgi:hypothetical protein
MQQQQQQQLDSRQTSKPGQKPGHIQSVLIS